MKTFEPLRRFADKFILATARERFIHEARKKPQRVLDRVCHNAHELFDTSLKGNRFQPTEADDYLMLSGKSGFIVIQGSQVSRRIGTGEGVLIISMSGEAFYAETEAMRGIPAIEYRGR